MPKLARFVVCMVLIFNAEYSILAKEKTVIAAQATITVFSFIIVPKKSLRKNCKSIENTILQR